MVAFNLFLQADVSKVRWDFERKPVLMFANVEYWFSKAHPILQIKKGFIEPIHC